MRTEIPSIWTDYCFVYNPKQQTSMQELVMQDFKQKRKLQDLSSLLKRHLACRIQTYLQALNYVITVNICNDMNNIVTKNSILIPIDVSIVLSPYKFTLQAMHYSHYITSVNCCDETIYCNDNKITGCNIINTRKSTVYILLYKLIVKCSWSADGGWKFINSHGAGTFVCPIKCRSNNRY